MAALTTVLVMDLRQREQSKELNIKVSAGLLLLCTWLWWGSSDSGPSSHLEPPQPEQPGCELRSENSDLQETKKSIGLHC